MGQDRRSAVANDSRVIARYVARGSVMQDFDCNCAQGLGGPENGSYRATSASETKPFLFNLHDLLRVESLDPAQHF